MTDSAPRLSSIAYSVGDIKPVSSLMASENVGAKIIASLEERGLRYYCEDRRSTAQMCLASIEQTLSKAGLLPTDIDAIVVGPSMARWDLQEEFALLRSLHGAGFSKSRIIGVALQACSVVASALQIARNLVESGARARRALVVIFGRHLEGSRLAPQATTLFSDGAVSCIVSADEGEFEIVATESITDTSLTTMEWTEENFPRYFQAGVASLRDVTARVYAHGHVTAKDIAAAMGTNGSLLYLQMIGLAAGLSGTRVYKGDLPRYAHVFGCDNLISLHSRIDETSFSVGQYALLVAWAPYVVGACLLKYVDK